jgi:hypothetical protein
LNRVLSDESTEPSETERGFAGLLDVLPRNFLILCFVVIAGSLNKRVNSRATEHLSMISCTVGRSFLVLVDSMASTFDRLLEVATDALTGLVTGFIPCVLPKFSMVERLLVPPLQAMPMLSFRTVVRGEKLVPLQIVLKS